MSSSASNLRTILVIVGLISSVHAARMLPTKQTIGESGELIGCEETSRAVQILVTRHGLSCANLIAKFSEGAVATKMHVFMWDPLLSAAGALATSQAGGDVANWLAKKQEKDPSFKVDAVLASHLARAWQTAGLQYPNYEVQGVPFISEAGFGKDNEAKPFEEQEKLVKEAIKGFQIDMKWLHKYGQNTKGNWEHFRNFLAQDFLPDFISTHSEKSTKEPIVLATVTHSNFMNSGEIKKKCQYLYPTDAKEGKPKANNNQVVLIPYVLHTQTCGAPGNRTVTHELIDDMASDEACSPVAIGL